MSNSYYKSYKHEEMKIAYGRKPINCKHGYFGEPRFVYTQTNALTGKNCTTVVIVPELIIEELSIASAGIGELSIVDVWVISMTFFAILNPDQSYPFQNDLKNVANKVTSNMKAASKQ